MIDEKWKEWYKKSREKIVITSRFFAYNEIQYNFNNREWKIELSLQASYTVLKAKLACKFRIGFESLSEASAFQIINAVVSREK